MLAADPLFAVVRAVVCGAGSASFMTARMGTDESMASEHRYTTLIVSSILALMAMRSLLSTPLLSFWCTRMYSVHALSMWYVQRCVYLWALTRTHAGRQAGRQARTHTHTHAHTHTHTRTQTHTHTHLHSFTFYSLHTFFWRRTAMAEATLGQHANIDEPLGPLVTSHPLLFSPSPPPLPSRWLTVLGWRACGVVLCVVREASGSGCTRRRWYTAAAIHRGGGSGGGEPRGLGPEGIRAGGD